MTTEEEDAFKEIVARLQTLYPKRQLEYKFDFDRWCVYLAGECQFTTLGYTFLCCISRLCHILEDELE